MSFWGIFLPFLRKHKLKQQEPELICICCTQTKCNKRLQKSHVSSIHVRRIILLIFESYFHFLIWFLLTVFINFVLLSDCTFNILFDFYCILNDHFIAFYFYKLFLLFNISKPNILPLFTKFTWHKYLQFPFLSFLLLNIWN